MEVQGLETEMKADNKSERENLVGGLARQTEIDGERLLLEVC